MSGCRRSSVVVGMLPQTLPSGLLAASGSAGEEGAKGGGWSGPTFSDERRACVWSGSAAGIAG